MMLVECVALHGPALRASFYAVYGFDHETVAPLEAADLAVWMPEGSALWRAVGGPLSVTGVEREMQISNYRLAVLAWMQTEDGRAGRNHPKPPKAPPYAGEAAVETAHAQRQAAARKRRVAG